MTARKRRVTASVRSFRRVWEDLLDDAGLKSAEDRQAALREAEKLPQLKLHRFKGRPHIVLKIEVPLESEDWLHAQFGSKAGSEVQSSALEVVEHWATKAHPLLPEAWEMLMSRLKTEFSIPRAVEPFRWMETQRVNELLGLLYALTSREWPEGTLIRDASDQIRQDSKYLEAQHTLIERALALLFGRETPLEALGIQTSNSVLHFAGPLVLHFDGKIKTNEMRYETSLAAAELAHALSVSTTARRLLTVENYKTTFRQLVRADASRSTLIVATSFPSEAVRLLLKKLPPDLPHHHFGDTDPAGWDILRKLREVTSRTVHPFHMCWQTKAKAAPLSQRDHLVLARLLASPSMEDCHPALEAMRAAGNKGSFEQESWGVPELEGWPFYRALDPGGHPL